MASEWADPASRKYLAFITPDGLTYGHACYSVLNVRPLRMMDRLLARLILLCYRLLEWHFIFSDMLEQHLTNLEAFFSRCASAMLQL